MGKPSKPFNDTSRELLKDPETALLYLKEIRESGDLDMLKAAVDDVAMARFLRSVEEGYNDISEGRTVAFTGNFRQMIKDHLIEGENSGRAEYELEKLLREIDEDQA